MIIKPTIGRVVWYYPRGSNPQLNQPFAATIAYVLSDTVVNLSVIDSQGVQFPETGVTLVQEGDEPPANLCWATWMPYQTGQAQRAEAAEKKLAERSA